MRKTLANLVSDVYRTGECLLIEAPCHPTKHPEAHYTPENEIIFSCSVCGKTLFNLKVELPLVRCEVNGCEKEAKWTGWVRQVDPFLGTPTGVVQQRNFCNGHKHLFIESPDDNDLK